MVENRIYDRMEALYKKTVYPLPPHLQMEYEAIDNEIVSYQEEA